MRGPGKDQQLWEKLQGKGTSLSMLRNGRFPHPVSRFLLPQFLLCLVDVFLFSSTIDFISYGDYPQKLISEKSLQKCMNRAVGASWVFFQEDAKHEETLCQVDLPYLFHLMAPNLAPCSFANLVPRLWAPRPNSLWLSCSEVLRVSGLGCTPSRKLPCWHMSGRRLGDFWDRLPISDSTICISS